MRLIFSLLISGMFAATSALAEVIVVSDACPVTAEAEPYQFEPDTVAEDLNPWSGLSFEDPLRVDVTVDQPPLANRVFQRVVVDQETGEALIPAPLSCADEVAVGQ